MRGHLETGHVPAQIAVGIPPGITVLDIEAGLIDSDAGGEGDPKHAVPLQPVHLGDEIEAFAGGIKIDFLNKSRLPDFEIETQPLSHPAFAEGRVPFALGRFQVLGLVEYIDIPGVPGNGAVFIEGENIAGIAEKFLPDFLVKGPQDFSVFS